MKTCFFCEYKTASQVWETKAGLIGTCDTCGDQHFDLTKARYLYDVADWVSDPNATVILTKKGKLMKYIPISKTAEAIAIAKAEAVLGRKLTVAELALVQMTVHHYHHNQ